MVNGVKGNQSDAGIALLLTIQNGSYRCCLISGGWLGPSVLNNTLTLLPVQPGSSSPAFARVCGI